MALDFKNLKKRRLDDDKPGRDRLRGKNEEDDEFLLNPYAGAKDEAYEEETDTIPVDDEETEIEDLVEGEAEHGAEDRIGEGEYEDETDLFIEEGEADEDNPEPGKKKKAKAPFRKGPPKKIPPKGGEDEKRGPSFSFRRFL